MDVRFYIDGETGLPHMYRHGIREREVEDILDRSGEDRAGRAGSRIAIGQTPEGRYLRVIYVPDVELDGVRDYRIRIEWRPAGRLSKAYASEAKMKQGRFPPGWDEERVRNVLAHYEEQTEEEAVAEDEAAFEDRGQAFIAVPKELVAIVRQLIARHPH